MRQLFLFALLTFSALAQANELIDSLQRDYGHKKSWPIVVFNKDQVQWRFARAKAIGDDKKELRYRIIQRYVRERVGLEISEIEASMLEPYLTVLKEGAFALPVLKSQFPVRYKLCAVFPASVNSSRELENERLLALNDKNIHPQREVHDYTAQMELEDLMRFSLYHELSHCLDEKYFPKTFEHEDAHQVHQSEAFAEVNAYFMLKLEGRELSDLRAKMRTSYSHFAGGYFAKNPHLGFGHPYFVSAGAIYHLGPILLQAAAFYPGVGESEKLTQRLVDQHTNDFRGFTAIVRYLELGPEAVNYYEERVRQWPDLFQQALDTLLVYQSTVPALAESLFEKNPTPREISDLPSLSQEICEYLSKNRWDDFQVFLTEQRETLRRSQANMKEKRAFKRELDEIYETRCD